MGITTHNRVRRFTSIAAAFGCWVPAVGLFAQDAPQEPEPPSERAPLVPPQATAPSELPEPKAIITQCIDAMGGDQTFEDMTSTMAKCRLVNPQMGEATLELYWMKPNKVFIKQQMPGMESTMGSDGSVAWMKTPLGPQILDAEAAREIREEANMFRLVIHLRDEMRELKTVEQTSFGEWTCYKISATDDQGDTLFAYFDVEDRLIRGVQQTEADAAGPTTYRFKDWKQTGEIKYFSRIEIEQRGQALSLIFDEVAFNSVDPKVFELPEDIAAMLKDREAPATQPATAPAEDSTR